MSRGGALRRDGIAVLSVGMALLALMLFTGCWPTRPNAYNSYLLQACAWLDGHLDLGRDYPHLELAIYGGRYYVSFPPFPSYVLLPFAALFGERTPDLAIALGITLIGVIYAGRLYRRTAGDDDGLYWVLFLYLGTGFLFVALNGYVWFLAQTMCFTLSLMALYYAGEGRGGAALALWACAVGCRPMTALYLPVLLYLLWRRRPPRMGLKAMLQTRWYWGLGPLLIGGSYMVLNSLRFGSVLEFGHNYLPEFTRAENGQFSAAYLAENVKNLLRLPVWTGDGSPVSFYSFDGMAFWLVDPLVFPLAGAWIAGLLRRGREERFLLIALPVLSAGYGLLLCLHRTLGGWQFGNRYLLDLLPWLFCGLCRWKPPAPWFREASVPFAVFGTALNLIGTAALYSGWI